MRAYELEESAVDELKNRLPKLKVHSYDTIDRLLNHVSARHKITGKKLHDMFVKKYGHTPDTWIKKITNKLAEEGVTEDAMLDTQLKQMQANEYRARVMGDLPYDDQYYRKQVDMLNKVIQNQNKLASQPQTTPAATAPATSQAQAPRPTSSALDNTPIANVTSAGGVNLGMSGTPQNPKATAQYKLDSDNSVAARAGNGTTQLDFTRNVAPDINATLRKNINPIGASSTGLEFDKKLGDGNGTVSLGLERRSDGQNSTNIGWRRAFEEINAIKRNAGIVK